MAVCSLPRKNLSTKIVEELTIAVKLISTAYIHAAATAFGGGNSSYVLFDMFPSMLTAGALKKECHRTSKESNQVCQVGVNIE